MTTVNACDTSVLVPTLLPWHPDHNVARQAFRSVEGLPAHVLVETFSVLTRLPAPHRVSPADASAALAALQRTGLTVLALPPEAHHPMIESVAREGLRGGAIYDALVGATAQSHEHMLLTRDRRASTTYDAVGVSYRFC